MPCDVSKTDRHIKDIEQALARAAFRAEKLARETGTPLVLWENGHIVEQNHETLSPELPLKNIQA